MERSVRNVIFGVAYMTIAASVALIGAPLALPILFPTTLVAYERELHLNASAQEQGDAGDALPPLFADMLGWHDFVREVGQAYDALPARERARTSIVVDNYGEAAALDVYGAAYHLPQALSGHNQYFLWGQRGQVPVDLLRVQFHPERLRPYCTEVTVLGETQSHFARGFENGRSIALCRGLHPSLSTLWPTLKRVI